MKLTEELANKVFDVLVNEGNHEKVYLDMRRDDFVDKMTTEGANEHWYPSENGSSIKVYFQEFSNTVYVYPQTYNHVHEKGLRGKANRALKELGFNVSDELLK